MKPRRTIAFRHVLTNFLEQIVFLQPRSSRDGSLIKANASIVAVQWATTGFGALAVLPTRDSDKSGGNGRLINPPLIEAHKSSLQDFDISPFHERLLATSDGGAIKLWQVPEDGLKETMREASGEVTGEAIKRLSALNFHPTSENLLTTCGKDFCLRLFDITNASQVVVLKEHSDVIMSTSWSIDGSMVATGCKDKQLRICDPRSGKVAQSTEAHPGVKGFMATWLGARSQICTVGFSKTGERQVAVWDFRAFSTPLHSALVDTNPGVITPYYDMATEMVFLLGRGDSTIRYYEVNDDEPYIHYLDQYRGAASQADITPFAKRFVDYDACEVARFAKLTKDKIEHLMFQVPRKDSKDSGIFHEDLYRYVPSSKPSTTAQEWLKGAKKDTIFLTTKEMMPKGYKSIYEVDPSRKAEDEKKEAEKAAFRGMSIEERAAAKEAMKDAAALAKRGGTGDAEIDEADDEATLAKFNAGGRSRSSSIATSAPPADLASAAPTSSSSTSTSSNQTPTKSSSTVATGAKPSPISLSSAASSNSAGIGSPRQGRHSSTVEDGSTYDGDYKNDQKYGKGTFTHKPDGSVYTGEWVDDKRSGQGTLKVGSGSSEVTVQGSWVNNTLETSSAIFCASDGATFEFATIDSSGKVTAGKLKYKDGEIYEGAFNSSGKRHGRGVCIGSDGSKYDGEYKDDQRHGKGEYHYPDGGVFKGTWKADLPDGKGEFFDQSGKVVSGTWSKGKLSTYTVA